MKKNGRMNRCKGTIFELNYDLELNVVLNHNLGLNIA